MVKQPRATWWNSECTASQSDCCCSCLQVSEAGSEDLLHQGEPHTQVQPPAGLQPPSRDGYPQVRPPLHYTILHNTILHNTILSNTILHYSIQYQTQYWTILSNIKYQITFCCCRFLLDSTHSPVVFCHNDCQEGTRPLRVCVCAWKCEYM